MRTSVLPQVVGGRPAETPTRCGGPLVPAPPWRGWAALRRVVVVSAVVALAACDSGPEGPGSLVGSVRAESLGGVVLEIEGVGIRGFTGRGNARVYSAVVPGRANTHRVVLIEPQGGQIGFEIQVDDLGMDGPIVDVIVATRDDNLPLSVSQVTVGLER